MKLIEEDSVWLQDAIKSFIKIIDNERANEVYDNFFNVFQEILESQDKAKKWDKYVKQCKNEECPSCQSTDIEKQIDWVNDIEEEIETFYCNKCHNRWTGGLV